MMTKTVGASASAQIAMPGAVFCIWELLMHINVFSGLAS
jgi:hypothetical protein